MAARQRVSTAQARAWAHTTATHTRPRPGAVGRATRVHNFGGKRPDRGPCHSHTDGVLTAVREPSTPEQPEFWLISSKPLKPNWAPPPPPAAASAAAASSCWAAGPGGAGTAAKKRGALPKSSRVGASSAAMLSCSLSWLRMLLGGYCSAGDGDPNASCDFAADAPRPAAAIGWGEENAEAAPARNPPPPGGCPPRSKPLVVRKPLVVGKPRVPASTGCSTAPNDCARRVERARWVHAGAGQQRHAHTQTAATAVEAQLCVRQGSPRCGVRFQARPKKGTRCRSGRCMRNAQATDVGPRGAGLLPSCCCCCGSNPGTFDHHRAPPPQAWGRPCCSPFLPLLLLLLLSAARRSLRCARTREDAALHRDAAGRKGGEEQGGHTFSVFSPPPPGCTRGGLLSLSEGLRHAGPTPLARPWARLPAPAA